MRLARRRTFTIVVLALTGGLLYACAGPTYVAQQYPGDPRDPETIAVIRVNGKDSVLLDSLDGEPIAVRLPEDSRLHVEVLPGPHKVGIANALDPESPPELVSFMAEANKVYRPVMRANPPPTSARLYEVDRGSDALIRDVTLAPPAEPPKPAPPPPAPAEPAPPVEPDAGSPEADAGASEVGDAGVPLLPPADAGAVAPASDAGPPAR